MAENNEAVKQVMSEVENFEADKKLKHVERPSGDSPALNQAKLSREIAKGAVLKPTETQVKDIKPTAEDIKAEKDGQ